MTHGSGLLTTIAVALTFAVVLGFVAARLRIPPIVGYLLAGVAIGPFTPGFVGDPEVAADLAEIGVILLMFGVGVHFSFGDLLAVRAIAVPGAFAQIFVAICLATIGAILAGWPVASGIMLGLALAVASTVVLLRALIERNVLDSPHGRIAVGWLIVEDIFTVVAIVALPTLAALGQAGTRPEVGAETAGLVALSLGKVVLLALVMYALGGRAAPWLLGHVERTGSRELFTLSVLGLALGIAVGAATLLDVSLALGAFLAGAAVAGSELGHRAATEALPFRDAFAVLFFVSVGMLVDPAILLVAPLAVLALVSLIVLGKGLAAFAIVVLFGYPLRTALTVAVGLAQIGEFSFILADLAVELGLLPGPGHQLILASAIITIALNPVLFRLVDPLEKRLARSRLLTSLSGRRAGELARLTPAHAEGLRGHAIVCGLGQVGTLVADVIARRNLPYVAIDIDRRLVERARAAGAQNVLYGDAADEEVLERAHISAASVLVIAIADPPVTRRIVEEARRLQPLLDIVARTHSETEWRYLRAGRVTEAVLGERELAIEIAGHALHRFGVSALEILAITRGLRAR